MSRHYKNGSKAISTNIDEDVWAALSRFAADNDITKRKAIELITRKALPAEYFKRIK